MRYVKQTITDYTSSNVTESISNWDEATTYIVSDLVLYDGFIYKSASAGNIANTPKLTDDNYWVLWDVSNKYGMIDLRSTTKTIVTGDDLIAEIALNTIDTLAIGYYSATTLKIEMINDVGTVLNTVLDETQSVNNEVIDYYSYFYEPYSIESNKGKYVSIPKIGTKIRVSFLKGTLTEVDCGFLIGGTAVQMGTTLDVVKFSFNSYSTKTADKFGIIDINKGAIQELIDFETIIEVGLMTEKKRRVKTNYDDIMAFIVDDSDQTTYENLVTLGTIQNVSTVAKQGTKTILTWSLLEII